MTTISLTIDNHSVRVPQGTTILAAARSVGIYIPTLCHHPDLPPAGKALSAAKIYQGKEEIANTRPHEPGQGCGLCVVEVDGEPDLRGACSTEAAPQMVVTTINDRITIARSEKLIPILVRHRHTCLTCGRQEGCSRSQCSSNVPEEERCCPQFGHCELQAVVNFIGMPDRTPKWVPTRLPILSGDPLFARDYNLCIGCTRCVRVCKDVRGVGAIGFVYDGNGQIQVGTLAPELDQSGCRFCTACVAVCPTGALTDKVAQAGREEKNLVPGRQTCPAGIDIPGYLRGSLQENPFPPRKWLDFTTANIAAVPESEGVYQLLDKSHGVLAIKGTSTLRRDLLAVLEENETAAFFEYEEAPLYSQRESELIQKHLQGHGEMPGGGDDDLDDLF